MRIAIVTAFWDPPRFRGGISRVVYELRKTWLEHGHTVVHVFATETVHNPTQGIFKIPIPTSPLQAVWTSLYLGMFHKLDSYDIIFPQSLIYCLFLNKKKCVPFIHTLSNVEHRVPWRIWRYAQGPLERLAQQDMPACVVLTEESKRIVQSRSRYPCLTILKTNNGVDLTAFFPKENQDSECFTILSAGRFIPRKRFDLLIRSFGLFAQRHPGAQLVLAGDGDLRKELEKLAGDLGVGGRVHFPGLVDGTRMCQLYQSAALFVLPSRAEGMPMVALEAQASGLPTIVADFDSSDEVIEDNRTGFIMRTDNPQDWAERFSVLYHDVKLRQQFGIEARRRIIESFGWDSVADRIMSQFVEVMKRSG